jgi:hypothetical protein
MEELFFFHDFRDGVMANENELDALVVTCQKQVQQDEEPLGEILAILVHRAGHVHQAKHHRLRDRSRL